MMGREKSDDRIVPEGRRKAVPTRGLSAGGKAVTVRKDSAQLSLFDVTAVWPKASAKRLESESTIQMEDIVEESNLRKAFQNVARNRGAPGPDGRSIQEVRASLEKELPRIQQALLQGKYHVGEIRRVFIAKANGKERALGIPNVVDRWVAQAILQVLSPLCEGEFHPSSHGFRPHRSCHTALEEAVGYVRDGYRIVVDLDLEDFFNRVHHQRLLARLEAYSQDKRVLRLLARMLKARVVLPDGIKVEAEMGTPQGGPLSPLLSNLVLDELDKEISRRGLRFVRYADDVRIFVRTQTAGQRVMASIKRFIEKRLRLAVNKQKSRVTRVRHSPFLGFEICPTRRRGKVEVRFSKRAYQALSHKIRKLTPRTWGQRLKDCIEQLNRMLRGWLGYFAYAGTTQWKERRHIDSHIRRRLRAIVLRQWKRKRTIARRLIRLGVPRKQAWSIYKGSRSWWSLSKTNAVHKGLSNDYFAKMGLFSVAGAYREVHQQVMNRLRCTGGT